MKKILGLLFFLVIVAAGVAAWILLGSATGFDQQKETLYIPSNAATKQSVLDSIHANRSLPMKRLLNSWRRK